MRKTIGSILKEHRTKWNLTIKQVEGLTGVNNLSRYENDTILPSIVALHSLSKFYRFSIDSIMNAVENNPTDDYDNLVKALEELVQLKEWKDKHGKDEHFLNAHPTAWNNAKEALKNAKK